MIEELFIIIFLNECVATVMTLFQKILAVIVRCKIKMLAKTFPLLSLLPSPPRVVITV